MGRRARGRGACGCRACAFARRAAGAAAALATSSRSGFRTGFAAKFCEKFFKRRETLRVHKFQQAEFEMEPRVGLAAEIVIGREQ